jgi:amino acid transporter
MDNTNTNDNDNEQEHTTPNTASSPEQAMDSDSDVPTTSHETLHIEYQTSPYPHCPLNHVRLTEQDETSLLRRLLVGRPLRAEHGNQEQVGKRLGLGIFAADALSSVAYATREMLHILVLAGAAALSLSIPIAGAICILLVLITLSYRQIIFAYPSGGGSYTVARDNLGMHTAQIAGAALLTDYVLTVAVSITAGVEQIISAFPNFYPYRIVLCLVMLLVLTLLNLRGMHGSIKLFAIPTYFFIGMMTVMLVVGFWRWQNGSLSQVEAMNLPIEATQPLTIFLVLQAFSAGSTALTGVKAISSRIHTFKQPRSRNAATTLLAISIVLMLMFMGVTVLARFTHALPMEQETIISQLARVIFAFNPAFYYLTIAATALILVMAANTSFSRFPRLAALQAEDGFLPHQFTLRGHRLVFWWGIVVLALCAAALIIIFDANTSALIPLYAIGVFLSFTLSQAGMIVRWRKISKLKPGEEVQIGRSSVLRYDSHWRTGLVINTLGCITTAIVTLVFTVTRFTSGAWIVVVVMSLMVWLFYLIKRHYVNVARSLSLEQYRKEPEVDPAHHKVVILVSGVHRGTLVAARYARTIQAHKIVAVYVETDAEQTLKIHERWSKWMPEVPLVVVDSPYRTLFRPLAAYINMLAREDDTELVTIVIPQFVCVRWWHHLLHNQTALMIRSAFLFDRDKVVIEVPFRLEE